MASSDDQQHLQPYRDAVEQFGPSFEATLWGTREAQHLRFDVMIDLADLRDCTVVDIGCGQGDFAAHLLQRDIEYAHFVGFDAMVPMIDAATKRQLPRSNFHACNILQQLDSLANLNADYITMSGTLNTMDDTTARQLVLSSFEASAQGVIFNFLSDRAAPEWLERDLGPARRFNTLNWLDWAMTLSPRVSFTQHYMDGHDATIMIRH
jgi:SAM-dependent methyltransferase